MSWPATPLTRELVLDKRLWMELMPWRPPPCNCTRSERVPTRVEGIEECERCGRLYEPGEEPIRPR